MEKLILERDTTNDDGTFGRLIRAGKPIAYTCEDPWLNNAVGESCIPKGVYLCIPHDGTLYKGVWRLKGVPGRKDILIHNGNTEDNTRGCILVGDSLGVVNGKPAVLNSKAVLKKLKQELPRSFYLQITGVCG